MGELMKIPSQGVVIRMYRVGLGDCFLLAFAQGDETPYHLLIDCGVHQSVQGGAERMREIAGDVAKVTQGHLNAVVVTHPHWDHTSGFTQAADTFRQMQIDELWLAWTERPDDPQACRLRSGRQHLEQRLRAMAERYPDEPGPAEGLRMLLGCCEAEGQALAAAVGAAAPGDYLKDDVRRVYCEPGGQAKGPTGVTFHVLGPPRDESLLAQMDPRAPDDVYVAGALMRGDLSFLTAAAEVGVSLPEEAGEAEELTQPFASRYRIQAEAAKQEAFFQCRYFSEKAEWRQIEQDWLGSAEELALRLDNVVNNTSLVLAIELPSGNVLLFPGDAQVGNWLSWCDGAKAPAEQLLPRTVLYKVSHHGSVNGTLRGKGLERMQSASLTALLPVDEYHARHIRTRSGKGWDMPHDDLLHALERLTADRIARSDKGLPEQAAWPPAPPQMDALCIDIAVE